MSSRKKRRLHQERFTLLLFSSSSSVGKFNSWMKEERREEPLVSRWFLKIMIRWLRLNITKQTRSFSREGGMDLLEQIIMNVRVEGRVEEEKRIPRLWNDREAAITLRIKRRREKRYFVQCNSRQFGRKRHSREKTFLHASSIFDRQANNFLTLEDRRIKSSSAQCLFRKKDLKSLRDETHEENIKRKMFLLFSLGSRNTAFCFPQSL